MPLFPPSNFSLRPCFGFRASNFGLRRLNESEQNGTSNPAPEIPLRPSPRSEKSHKIAQNHTLLTPPLPPIPRHAPADLARTRGSKGAYPRHSDPTSTPTVPQSNLTKRTHFPPLALQKRGCSRK